MISVAKMQLDQKEKDHLRSEGTSETQTEASPNMSSQTRPLLRDRSKETSYADLLDELACSSRDSHNLVLMM